MEEHENNDRYHLQLLTGSHATLKKQHSELKASFDSLKDKLYYQSLHSTTLKVNLMARKELHFMIQATPKSYNIRVSFYVLLGNIMTSFIVKAGEYDDELKWPFKGKVKVELLNQLEDENHITRLKSIVQRRPSPAIPQKSGSTIYFANTLEKKYYIDKKAYFRITVISRLCQHWLDH